MPDAGVSLTNPPSHRVRTWLLGTIVVLVALFGLVALSPIIRVAALALHDEVFTLKKKPAPYRRLPPPGPALASDEIVFDSDRAGNFEIYTMLATGKNVHRLTLDPRYDSWWARLSPDRRYILFYRSPRGVHDHDPSKNSLWVMDADGSNVTQIRPRGTDGWRVQGHAEWSHDGKSLVMIGGSRTSPQIYVTTNTGLDPRDVTHRNGSNIDPSWSPDDSTIYFIRCPSWLCTPGRQEVYSGVDASSHGAERRLTHDGLADYDPYASPDGTRLAWLTETSHAGKVGTWNIRTMTLPQGSPTFLTDDHNINSKPAWSADGRLIFFHRLVKGDGAKFEVWEIEADGTGLREITKGQPGVNEYPGT